VSETAKQLLVAVQALPNEEQRELADAVLDDLGEPELTCEEWEEEWGPEIDRRIEEMRNGTVETVAWEEIKAKLKAFQS
jgi:putative addiction module component (TIGR02574 family)